MTSLNCGGQLSTDFAIPFFYSLYGLTLRVNRPIAGLVTTQATDSPHVLVTLERLPGEFHNRTQEEHDLWYLSPHLDEYHQPVLRVWKLADGSGFRLLYSDGTEFFVNCTGTHVWGLWPETLTLGNTAIYLVGPIFGFVLRLRGITCLHASAIVVGGRAVALVGGAGAGKSTTAAVFSRQGYPVLSEDIVALIDREGILLAQPGYPRVNLWPKSVSSLYGSQVLPRIIPTWDKLYLDLQRNGHHFHRQPAVLGAVYLLGERRSETLVPCVEDLSPREALISLVGNTYTTYLLDRKMRAREFEFLTQLVTRVPVRRVVPHDNPAHLDKLCDTILSDLPALPTESR